MFKSYNMYILYIILMYHGQGYSLSAGVHFFYSNPYFLVKFYYFGGVISMFASHAAFV